MLVQDESQSQKAEPHNHGNRWECDYNHVPLDGSYLIEAVFYKKQDGEYRLLPYKFPPTGIFTAANNDLYFNPEVAKVPDSPLPLLYQLHL